MMDRPLVKVFISYAEEYPDWAINELTQLLDYLKQKSDTSYHFDYWYDKSVISETGFHYQLVDHLYDADIVLCLITRDFFESLYITAQERSIIELKCDSGGSHVIPIIIEKGNYTNTWLSTYNLRTISINSNGLLTGDNPAAGRLEKWNTVASKLDERINAVYQVKLARSKAQLEKIIRINSRKQIDEKSGSASLLFWTLCVLVAFLCGYSIFTYPNQEADAQGTFYSQGRYTSMTISDVEIVDPVTSRDDDRAIEGVDGWEASTSSSQNVPRSSRERENKRSILDSYSALPTQKNTNRPIAKGEQKTYSMPGYGSYESCQGWDENGYRPCKKDHRWYIVNERKNIHHLIELPIETHKDIYAIRPFRNQVAQVFYYNGKRMYLEFCVNLDDQVVSCSISDG